MTFRYGVIGAGRQGVAAAYDLARMGDAESVCIADADAEVAAAAAERVNRLLGREIASPRQVDVADAARARDTMDGLDACVSAVPYRFNLALTHAAIASRCSFCDLGGNTEVV